MKYIENVNAYLSQMKIKQTYISLKTGIDTKKLSLIGNAPAATEYFLYEDDGFTTDISLEKYSRILKK